MKSFTHYQLMKVDAYGREQPVSKAPGEPLGLFTKKGDAQSFAQDNPELFPSGRYCIKSILVLEKQEEKEEEEVLTAVDSTKETEEALTRV